MSQRTRFSFQATGGEYFGFVMLQMLLVFVTLGIWLIFLKRALLKWRMKHTFVDGEPCEYREQFVDSLLHGLKMFGLMLITLGFYGPWAVAATMRFTKEHCLTADGRRFTFRGKGSEVLVHMLLASLVIPFTLGFMTPWVVARWKKWEHENTYLSTRKVDRQMRGSLAIQEVASGSWERFAFDGEWSGLMATYVTNYLLSMLTLGIYRPWAKIKELQWEHLHVSFRDAVDTIPG